MRARTRALLDELHLPIDPDARAESLSAAHRQLLQVARALAFECRILVLDEPTTSLTDAEADHLFAVLEKLKARGVTLLYVSHRLPEVFRLCDRITVLRDGALRRHLRAHPTSRPNDIVRAMVGRELPPRAERDGARRRGSRRRSRSAVAQPPAVFPRRRRCRSARARSSGCSASSAPDARSCSRRSSVCTGRTPEHRCRVAADGHVCARRATRRAPASRSCRRSGSARGCSST